MGRFSLAIEHIGSTSVPGLAAKPIININVVIASNNQLSKNLTSQTLILCVSAALREHNSFFHSATPKTTVKIR
ncbi:MAG: GrpB family protein [Desmonostoc vinosum HA7617-LM4]|nr:GrpB family protein [Desmonostoc vinosum HA7617-LM4]